MDLYLKDALSVDDVKERGDKLRARKAELTTFLSSADEPPPVLHPAMAKQYRLRVQHLYETLQDGSEDRRTEAADVRKRGWQTALLLSAALLIGELPAWRRAAMAATARRVKRSSMSSAL